MVVVPAPVVPLVSPLRSTAPGLSVTPVEPTGTSQFRVSVSPRKPEAGMVKDGGRAVKFASTEVGTPPTV